MKKKIPRKVTQIMVHMTRFSFKLIASHSKRVKISSLCLSIAIQCNLHEFLYDSINAIAVANAKKQNAV